MKKSLIALAALATVATAAQAQSSVTLYGVMDVGVRYDNSAAATKLSQTTMAQGILNTSRWGLRGTEDLGGGLKANFNLESGLYSTTGAQQQANSLFDRRAVVGLEGSWGKTDLGRNTTLTYDMSASYVTDPLGNELANQSTNSTFKATAINPVNLITGASGLNNVRRDNSIKYVTAFGPTTLGLMYSVGGQAGDTQKNSSKQASLRYTANGADLGAAYDDLSDANNKHQKVWTAGGNYTVNGVKVTAGYSELLADPGFTPSTSILALGTSSITNIQAYVRATGTTAVTNTVAVKSGVWAAGVGYNFTPALNVVGAYYKTKHAAAGYAAQEYSTYIIRSKYALSKRTDLFAEIDYTKSNDVPDSATVNRGTNNTGVAAGIQHRF